MTVSISGTGGVTFNDNSVQNTAATGFGFKNRIINGAMVIDQRNAGASVTPNNTYTLDRWATSNSQTSKFTIQQNAGSVTLPAGFSNYLGVTSSSAYSVLTGDYFGVYQAVEGFNVADFAWGTASAATVTLSFLVRSSLTGTFGGSVRNSAVNRSYPFTFTVSSANTWETKSVTIAGDTTGTWTTNNTSGMSISLGLGVGATFSGTAGAWAAGNYLSATGATSVVGTSGATFYITGVQLEKGSTATSFDYRPYGTELALCQRYYQRTTAETASATLVTGVICSGATSGNGGLYLIGVMRTTPTLDSSAASTFAYSDGATGTACTAVSLAGSQSNSRLAAINFSTGGGLTQYRPYRIEANSSTTAYLGFSSEL